MCFGCLVVAGGVPASVCAHALLVVLLQGITKSHCSAAVSARSLPILLTDQVGFTPVTAAMQIHSCQMDIHIAWTAVFHQPAC